MHGEVLYSSGWVIVVGTCGGLSCLTLILHTVAMASVRDWNG